MTIRKRIESILAVVAIATLIMPDVVGTAGAGEEEDMACAWRSDGQPLVVPLAHVHPKRHQVV